ncbi:MAG: hypothetical protein LBK59_09770 [Bifidobacteriaceae bacterium]|nr:hypothetical protein [Bifidobacteriaceae bacterium]
MGTRERRTSLGLDYGPQRSVLGGVGLLGEQVVRAGDQQPLNSAHLQVRQSPGRPIPRVGLRGGNVAAITQILIGQRGAAVNAPALSVSDSWS